MEQPLMRAGKTAKEKKMIEATAKHLIKFLVWAAAAAGCYYLSKYLGTLHPIAGRISILASIVILIVLKVKMSLSFIMVIFGIILLFVLFVLLSIAGINIFNWILGK
jgi:hypothetical protein